MEERERTGHLISAQSKSGGTMAAVWKLWPRLSSTGGQQRCSPNMEFPSFQACGLPCPLDVRCWFGQWSISRKDMVLMRWAREEPVWGLSRFCPNAAVFREAFIPWVSDEARWVGCSGQPTLCERDVDLGCARPARFGVICYCVRA